MNLRPALNWINGFWPLLRQTFVDWQNEKAMRLAAALSYYTVFSLAPLLVVAVAIAGLAFGREAVQGELSVQLRGLIGGEGAHAVESLVASAWKPSSGIVATIIGVITLILGGTAVFTELRSILNQIWRVPPQKISGVWFTIKDKLLSFAMMAAVGFLLLVSLIANTLLSAATQFFKSIAPMPSVLDHILYAVVSFLIISGLFAAIFKVLPETDVKWRDVWAGSFLTAFFFSIGKFLIGLYLGRASVTSSFGASASLVVIMLWAFYSSLIVIFGAEFTHVHARRRDRAAGLTPDRVVGIRPPSPRSSRSKRNDPATPLRAQ